MGWMIPGAGQGGGGAVVPEGEGAGGYICDEAARVPLLGWRWGRARRGAGGSLAAATGTRRG